MPIPSVVIEPASSNEGDDDRDADIISPTNISDNGETGTNQTVQHMSPSGGGSAVPDDFMYKVGPANEFNFICQHLLVMNGVCLHTGGDNA